MAKKNASATENQEVGGEGSAEADEAAVGVSAPNGFRLLTSVSDAPWWTVKEGNELLGDLLGRYQMNNDTKRVYYQVEIYKPTTVTIGRGDEAEEKVVPKGTIVNLGATKTIGESLDPVVVPEIIAGGRHDVWVGVDKKIKISGGKTFWMMKVASKRTAAPKSQVIPLVGASAGAAAEDAPF